MPTASSRPFSPHPPYLRACVGGLLSLAAATACFAAQLVILKFLSVGEQLPGTTGAVTAALIVFLSAAFGALALAFAGGPVALAVIAARRFGITSLAYYAAAYLLAAGLSSLLVANLFPWWHADLATDREALLQYLRFAVLPALCGALVFWLSTGRRHPTPLPRHCPLRPCGAPPHLNGEVKTGVRRSGAGP